ncbi:hypothetical protein Tco_1032207 [Tanacetum coccineum]|uniref:Uncharacterized protein n=1 Tax=Tanacetum coccineum TaxID=301880 RepID=A0ABQ5GBM8_9ASTR
MMQESSFLYKQESSSKSRQARVDKKETGGKQETAIDEKAENTVKECTNWKDKKKDKEQEALLISEDTAFVITGENIGPKPNPDLKHDNDMIVGCIITYSLEWPVDRGVCIMELAILQSLLDCKLSISYDTMASLC